MIPVIVYLTIYHSNTIQSDRYYLLAIRAEKYQNWKAVTYFANKAYTLNPKRKKILSSSARGYIESGEFQKGLAALKTVIKAYPFNMNANLNLGSAYFGLQKYDRAMESFQRTLEIKPDFSKAHAGIGKIHMIQKEYFKAVCSFQKGLKNIPDNAVILNNLGFSQFQIKSYKDAAQTLKKTVALQPGMVSAQMNLAVLYYKHLNQQEKGIKYFKNVLTLKPDLKASKKIKKLINNFP
ncbi:MAG: tetratricopeptide repeat protein [Thermodesulfobacteriota bacterium]|nr:tetratricopeptide repeat protein [Thermodesulfobacteriota bacterium]